MIATTSSNLRENMKEYFDRVTNDYETMIVTRRDDANVVVISQAEWESLQETLYLMGSKANRRHLEESMAQLEAGRVEVRELIEDDDE